MQNIFICLFSFTSNFIIIIFFPVNLSTFCFDQLWLMTFNELNDDVMDVTAQYALYRLIIANNEKGL